MIEDEFAYLVSPKEVVSDQRLEAVLAEAVDVRDEFRTDGEIPGAAEKRFGGGAKAIVALDDFLNVIVGESFQNPQIAS